MVLSAEQEKLLSALQDGLPVTARPYREIGARIGADEEAVIDGIRRLQRDGVIKRFGVIVRHRTLGIVANAMLVFDVPDDAVDAVGAWLGERACVTLCYRRPRRPPSWPYNLFCMIHGRTRKDVRAEIQRLRETRQVGDYPFAVLFSTRCFKQRGARYRPSVGVRHAQDT